MIFTFGKDSVGVRLYKGLAKDITMARHECRHKGRSVKVDDFIVVMPGGNVHMEVGQAMSEPLSAKDLNEINNKAGIKAWIGGLHSTIVWFRDNHVICVFAGDRERLEFRWNNGHDLEALSNDVLIDADKLSRLFAIGDYDDVS